ncbi:MAG: hypothetical protein R3B09_09120 [Nannocystaceae bacterium]
MCEDAAMSSMTLARSIAARSALMLLLGCSGGDDEGSTTATTNATTTTATATTATSTTTGAATETSTTSGSTEGTSAGSSSSASTTTSASTTADPTTGTSTSGGAGGFCQEACDGDGDCLIDGVDEGYVCTDHRCRPSGTPDKCNSDLFCAILIGATFFNFCESADECDAGRVCVALEGFNQGACVPLTEPMGVCDEPFDPMVLPLLEGGEAEVCIALTAYCDHANGVPQIFDCNATAEGCVDDRECTLNPSQPVCDGDGACVCTSDAHCADVVGLPHCVDGRCACTSDDECAALTGADACVDGLCGCKSAAVCPDMTYYDGTSVVCEPI